MLFQNLFDLGFDFRLLERAALNLVVSLRVHQIFRAQHPEKLAHVHFRHQHVPVALHHFAQISRQRIQVAQVHVSDAMPLGALRYSSAAVIAP